MTMDDEAMKALLTSVRRIALVGASEKPDRPAFGVMRFLLAQGFDVTPVNPALAGRDLLGRQVVASLADAAPLEMVDLFRRSDAIEEPVRHAVACGAKIIWMQLGVINEPAAAFARAAGLTVIMDRCPVIEMHRLGLAR
jgi:predicted CoA-binding protein